MSDLTLRSTENVTLLGPDDDMPPHPVLVVGCDDEGGAYVRVAPGPFSGLGPSEALAEALTGFNAAAEVLHAALGTDTFILAMDKITLETIERATR